MAGSGMGSNAFRTASTGTTGAASGAAASTGAANTSAQQASILGMLGAAGFGGNGLGTTSSGSGDGVSGTGVTINAGSTPADVSPIDVTAANAATFGAAKDQAGQTGRSQIDSMNGLLGAAGMLGGGAQAQGTRDIVEQAGQGANDVTRANAVNKAQSDLETAKTNQAAQLTERGQNISAQQAQAQLAMEQAQLNSQRQLSLLQTVLGFAGSGGGSSTSNTTGLY